MSDETTTNPRVKIVAATREQESVLANLLELYAHDFSEVMNLEIGEDGRFGYEHLPLYWSEADRHPFLIRADGHIAGFVFVTKGSRVSGDEGVWDVAEFFVLRAHRRRGVGVRAALAVWRMFPGRWEVRVLEQNEAARNFWRRAVREFTGDEIEEVAVEDGGKSWRVFSFVSKSLTDRA